MHFKGGESPSLRNWEASLPDEVSGLRRALCSLLLLCAFLGGCSLQSETTLQPIEPAPEPPALSEQPAGPPIPAGRPPLQLTFVGDIMLARTPGEAVEQGHDPFAGSASALGQGDLTIGNLECVIATTGQRVPKAYNFRCHPRTLPWLARYFDALSVANNHSGDYGKEAFLEQLDWLEGVKIRPFGGGRNEEEAYAPVILTKKGWRVALIGVNGVELQSYEAGPDMPGLAWLYPERIAESIRAARAAADLVVVLPHWGYEYKFAPAAEHQALARFWLESGADMIIGTHPHVIQPIHQYDGKLVAYSLGNFVFDDFLDVSSALDEPSRHSWILHVTVMEGGAQRWQVQTARTDDLGLPQLVPNEVIACDPGGLACTIAPK